MKFSQKSAKTVSLLFCIPVLVGVLTGCQLDEKWKSAAQGADFALKHHQYQKCQASIKQAFADLGPARQNGTERFDLLVLSGNSYLEEGKFDEAATAYNQALTVGETLFGPHSVHLSAPLDGLRSARFHEHKYELAEGFARRLLSIEETAYGPEDARLEPVLSSVIGASCVTGKCVDEIDLLQRLLRIREKMLGPDHKHTFVARQLLAEAYVHRREYDKALTLYEANFQSARRANSSLVVGALINVGRVLQLKKQYAQAEQKLQQALTLEQLNANKSGVAGTLMDLADLYKEQGKLEKSIATYKEAVGIAENIHNKDQTVLSKYLASYADGLRKAGRQAQANQVQKEIDQIAEQSDTAMPTKDKRAI